MRVITIFIFVLLGCNYLLPFNTFVNTFSYLEKTSLSPFIMVAILNTLYQVVAIVINGVLSQRKYQCKGYEMWLGVGTIFGVCSTTLLTIMCGAIPLSGLSLALVLCVFIILQSGCSSVFDAINVHFANKMGENAILYYSVGINVSGTIHAAICVVLNLITLSNNWGFYTGYYLITTLLLALGFIPYLCLFWKLESPSASNSSDDDTADDSEWWPSRYYLCLIFINFVVTLTIYPTMLVRTNTKLFPLYNEVLVFFLFNFAALCGNMMAAWKPIESLYTMLFVTLARCCVLLPLGICYHFLINEITHGMIASVGVGIAVFAYTSGYMTSSIYYQAPKSVGATSRVLVLRCLNLAISLGLFFGSVLALSVEIVKKYNFV